MKQSLAKIDQEMIDDEMFNQLFESFNKDGKGIRVDEMGKFATQVGVEITERNKATVVDEVLARFGKDKNGALDKSEFRTFLLQ